MPTEEKTRSPLKAPPLRTPGQSLLGLTETAGLPTRKVLA